MEKFKQKNGWARAANRIALWCLLLTVGILFVLVKLKDIKKNYTLLHHKVNTLMDLHKQGH